MVEIKEVSYKEDRLRFFVNKRNAVQRRYNRLERSIAPDESYLSERIQLLDDCGRELSFYDDVIAMLAAEAAPRTEVQKEVLCDVIEVLNNKFRKCDKDEVETVLDISRAVFELKKKYKIVWGEKAE